MKKSEFSLAAAVGRFCIAAMSVALFAVSLSSCSSDDDASSQADVLKKAKGIVELKSGIGEWDAAYLTKSGYFCLRNDFADADASAASKYSSVAYMSADGSDLASLISTKADNIPSQLVTKKGVLYFSFPNDTILELLLDDGKQVVMLDSIPYSKADLIANAHGGDAFKAALSNAAELLQKSNSDNSQGKAMAKTYGDVFAQVSGEPYVDDEALAGEMTTTDSGDYEFAEAVGEWYDDEVGGFVYNALSIWTGKATYKVGGSSCTLSGTIWCPSGTYNQYGTYGILCDASKEKLTVGNAEYEDTGLQDDDDLSYSVDFRGLKPNTTYYYRAFYKFNGSDHGSIVPKHGSPTDQVVYDQTIKSFTTGDNALTVDVVMCIDVTGSMSGIINTVKNNAMAFYDLFNKSCEEEGIILTGLNSQVVAFQDKNVDGSRWMNVSPTYSLPTQKSDFNSFVEGLYADGGGDTPESGLEALEIAFDKADWGVDDGYHRQVVILWTDAPYLVGSSYSSITTSALMEKWNDMPSGRRLILFAPNGTGGNGNGGDWAALDGWKNVIHETDLVSGFGNFEYILKSIIGELTSKGKSAKAKAPANMNLFFRPNK